MNAAATIREYYDALRTGDSLAPFFADGETDDEIVKFGISERLVGAHEIATGLREQTETTTDWTVDSRDLRVTERSCHAWFSDDVSMAWTDTNRQIRFEFETRWSGTLEARDEDGAPVADATNREAVDWQFVGMHVSTAGSI
ncbi:nuclear transport factor 2 family protein [Halorientalis brevis]|uniref:Nuclear transport factor 2 family protein n=1 Tax=Halorientalis brevis TaxID=1126241 RepID=A0ABD6CHF1_9EURY|nr:nuclear transport factor 2 family protein [Halorientalis brevis]